MSTKMRTKSTLNMNQQKVGSLICQHVTSTGWLSYYGEDLTEKIKGCEFRFNQSVKKEQERWKMTKITSELFWTPVERDWKNEKYLVLTWIFLT